MFSKEIYQIIPVVNKDVDFSNLSNQLLREIGTENYSYVEKTPNVGNSASLTDLWIRNMSKRYEAMELHVVEDRKPESLEWGVGHATGIKIPGKGYQGRGHYIFHQDGTTKGKVNAICAGSKTIVASTLALEDWNIEGYFPQIPDTFKHLYSKLGEGLEVVSLAVDNGKVVTDETRIVIIEPAQANWNRNELEGVLKKFENSGLSVEDFIKTL